MQSIQYTLIRSARSTIWLEIRDGKLIVRAPRNVPLAEVEAVIRKKENWIRKHLEKSREELEAVRNIRPLTTEELRELGRRAVEYLPGRVKYYAEKIGVSPRKITIRNQRTRWGSCSAKGNLNFNCLLMLTPPEVIDSIVVHELCHMKQMNHSDAFYREVLRVYPEYYRWHGWLKEHQAELLARLG